MKSSIATLLLVALACNDQVVRAAESNPRDGVAFYLQTYGQLAPADLPDVYAIFEQVRATADHSSLVTPRLVVVRDAPQALAFTLSDGTILLSAKALAVLRGGASPAEVRARIAFVLGHELAHLAANDSWDSQIAQALTSMSRPGAAKDVVAREPSFVELSLFSGSANAADQQKKELKADDLGFLYAALAGYRVDTLLESTRGAEDFLTYWNAQVGRRSDPNYPQAAERSGLLRLRLTELRNALNYFTYGVRLMHFGRHREAIAFFREFQQHFPGRELFNNLGYCHLQMALTQLDADFAYRYWLPMVSELNTPLTQLTTRSATQSSTRDPRYGRMNAPARENLLTAVRHFEQAIEKDARYAPAHVNLAVAQLLLGMRGAAQGPVADNHLLRAKLAIGAALNLQPEQVDVRMLAAIIDFELQSAEQGSGQETMSPRIASIGNVDAADPAFLYNLAQLTRDDAERSQRYWQRLLTQFDNLPKKLQVLVCRKQVQMGGARLARCDTPDRPRVTSAPPWPVPIKLSRDLLQNPFTPAELSQHRWQTLSLSNATVYSGTDNFVLAIDDIATLAVMRPSNMNTDALLQCCTQPLEKVSVANGLFAGSLWQYGRWIAVVKDARVEEIWVSN